MVSYVWDPVTVTIVMLFGALLGYAILWVARKITKPAPGPLKLKTYACGEEPAPVRPDSEFFFSPVRRVLRPFYRYIQPAHKGLINTYLLWVVLGMIVIFVVLLVVVKWV